MLIFQSNSCVMYIKSELTFRGREEEKMQQIVTLGFLGFWSAVSLYNMYSFNKKICNMHYGLVKEINKINKNNNKKNNVTLHGE